MRNRRWRNPAHRNDFSAIHLRAAGNGLKDAQARLIAQSLGDFLDLMTVHFLAVPRPARSLANYGFSRYRFGCFG